MDTDGQHGIEEERRHLLDPPLGVRRVDVGDRGVTDQRLLVLQRTVEGRGAGVPRVGGQQGEGGGADDRRVERVAGQSSQVRLGRPVGAAPGGQHGPVVRLPRLAVPVLVVSRVPFVGLVVVAAALRAGVGDADREGEVGARYPQAVVGAPVDDHVGLFRHVALHAQHRLARLAVDDLLVEVMVVAVVGVGQVALGAQIVPLEVKLQAVNVVAIAAAHVVPEHLALHERAVDVHLVQDLAVGVIEPLLEHGRHDVVEKVRPGVVVVAQHRPPRVAGGAELDLLARADAAGRYHEPVVLQRRPGHRRDLRPVDMARAGSVARLAAHVDLRPRGRVRLRLEVVALYQVGRMALGAHAVPVLGALRPVQPVVGRDLLAGVEIEPLPALDVPGDRQRLEPAAGKRDQITLQRLVPERVRDLELGRLAVRALGIDVVAAVATVEAGRDVAVLEDRVVEIAQNRAVRGHRHRQIVIGPAPRLGGRLVALGARLASHEGRRRITPGPRPFIIIVGHPFHRVDRDGQHDGRHGDNRHPVPAGHGVAAHRGRGSVSSGWIDLRALLIRDSFDAPAGGRRQLARKAHVTGSQPPRQLWDGNHEIGYRDSDWGKLEFSPNCRSGFGDSGIRGKTKCWRRGLPGCHLLPPRFPEAPTPRISFNNSERAGYSRNQNPDLRE